ncbi:MAG: hypothetical protein LBG97_03990 [Coriobacteriales bacterium]|jgi:hypothetical protein|nr:hypothetical protein [Coriobacteriales bacterium]
MNRPRVRAHVRVCLSCVFVLLIWAISLLTTTAATSAFATDKSETDILPVITLSAPTRLDVGLLPVGLPLECSPSTIQTGIDCGMEDMCGLDPCLCGNPDEWGACACNGVRQTDVELDINVVNSEVASILRLGDSWWVLPSSSGETMITVTATLPHYATSTTSVQLHVDAPLPPPVFWCVLGFIIAALLLFMITIIVKKKSRTKNGKTSSNDLSLTFSRESSNDFSQTEKNKNDNVEKNANPGETKVDISVVNKVEDKSKTPEVEK